MGPAMSRPDAYDGKAIMHNGDFVLDRAGSIHTARDFRAAVGNPPTSAAPRSSAGRRNLRSRVLMSCACARDLHTDYPPIAPRA